MRWDALAGLGQHYREQGHVVLPELIHAELAGILSEQFIAAMHADISIARRPSEKAGAVTGPALQIYGHRCPPLATFHWGLTPIVAAVTGLDLSPSYCIFRLNSRSSGLRVHRDRPASEHGISLPLTYSNNVPWPLEIGTGPVDGTFRARSDWGDLPHRSLSLGVGDALLYQGHTHAHGRTTPNPNGTSAHVFLFWVDRNGPHADWRFDRREIAGARARGQNGG